MTQQSLTLRGNQKTGSNDGAGLRNEIDRASSRAWLVWERSGLSAHNPFPAARGSHLLGLDAVRGIAVLLVFFHHAVIYSGLESGSTLDWFIRALGKSTWIGVDLFFVLSGFLITRVLVDAKGSPTFFGSFYGRRILRIFPLYYGFLLFALVIYPSLPNVREGQTFSEAQSWYWSYTSNVHVAIYGWGNPAGIGHFWSLAVEEQFYFIWPLFVWLFNRRQLAYVAIVCFVSALFLRLHIDVYGDPLQAYVLLPTRMDTFAIGAMAALAFQGHRAPSSFIPYLWLALLISGATILAITIDRGGWNTHDEVVSTFGYSVMAIACVCLVSLASQIKAGTLLARASRALGLTTFGKYSYGLYVFHVPMIMMLREAGLQVHIAPEIAGSQILGLLIFAATSFAASFGLSILSFHYWEKPFLKLKQYFPYQQRVTSSHAVDDYLDLDRKTGPATHVRH